MLSVVTILLAIGWYSNLIILDGDMYVCQNDSIPITWERVDDTWIQNDTGIKCTGSLNNCTIIKEICEIKQ